MNIPARPLRIVHPVVDPAAVDAAEAVARAQIAQARAELPALDDTAFDCFLGDLVAAVEPTSEADPVAILASLICAAGVHLGQKPHVRAGDDPHPLLVWPLIIGRTNAGRKGTSWSTARRLVAAADPDFTQANIKSGLSSGEGLAERFKVEEDADEFDRAAAGRDLRLMVMEAEWAGVMAKMKREGNTLSAILRSAWEGGDLSTLTVSARVAPSSHVGILAHITPQEFRKKVDASDMAGGTYNRFLPLAVSRSKFLPLGQGADTHTIDELGARFAEKLDTGGRLGLLSLTDDAAQLWRTLYVEFSTDHNDTAEVEQFISRAVPNCLRVAGIHAAMDGKHVITPDHLHAAAALIRYSINSARSVFTDTSTPRRLAAWIAETGTEGRSRKQITVEFFKGKTKADDITAMLDQLVAAGHLIRTTRARADGRPGGRPAEIFTANPANLANFRT